ncbi:MAG TPA: FKBP-type peptidyl-prolyl cis-trans isomerase [Rhodoglobus sp.]|nr:FKBP-type peptidyl-prolyl cis-trans isomerase [Rhodoglobus sp.]
MRKLASLAVTAGLLVTLSACSTAPSTTFADGCGPSGNAALVTADGPFGADPGTDFPTPIIAPDTDVAVLERGEGDPIRRDGAIDAAISIYDAETGDPLQSQSGELVGVAIRTLVEGTFPFTSAFTCTTEGSRVVTTGSPEQLFGPERLGLAEDQSIVVVSDIQDAYPGRADGADQLVPAGLPAVVLAPNGRPGFTFPTDTPPSDLRIAELKSGRGETVQEGDSVIVNYSGVVWGQADLFDTTWDDRVPRAVTASDFTQTDDGSGVVPGFAEALIGAKVGSQVIAVIPPEFGYPAGSAPATIGEDATLVFVIDILAVQDPADD